MNIVQLWSQSHMCSAWPPKTQAASPLYPIVHILSHCHHLSPALLQTPTLHRIYTCSSFICLLFTTFLRKIYFTIVLVNCLKLLIYNKYYTYSLFVKSPVLPVLVSKLGQNRINLICVIKSFSPRPKQHF